MESDSKRKWRIPTCSKTKYVKAFWVVVLISQCFLLVLRALAFLYALLFIGTLFSFTINTLATSQMIVAIVTTFVCFRIDPYPCDDKYRFSCCSKMKIYKIILWTCFAISRFSKSAVFLFVISSKEQERTIRVAYFDHFHYLIRGNAVLLFELFSFSMEYIVVLYFCQLFIVRYWHVGHRMELLAKRLPTDFLQMRRSDVDEFSMVRKVVSKYVDCNAMARRIFKDYSSVYFVWVSGFVVEVVFTVNWFVLVPEKSHALTLCLVAIFTANFLLICITVDISHSVDKARLKIHEEIRDYQLTRLSLSGKTSNTCHSIKILADFVASNRFAMSGMGFFYVDRGFLCKITGVLFTYSGLAYQFSYNAPH